MKSNLISKSQTQEIINSVEGTWNVKAPKIRNLRVHVVQEGDEIITDDAGWTIVRTGGVYLPFLGNDSLLQKFPNVTVDMGAVKFMCNGANVMRPGIRGFSEFQKDQVVCVAEESRHRFLAVGIAEVPSSDIKSMERGQVIRNMHHISDVLWEAGKTIKI